MLKKLNIRWNQFLLWTICFIASKLDYQTVDANALWDDAADYMEGRAKRNPFRQLAVFEKIFDILHHRANERLEDAETERRLFFAGKLDKGCYLKPNHWLRNILIKRYNFKEKEFDNIPLQVKLEIARMN